VNPVVVVAAQSSALHHLHVEDALLAAAVLLSGLRSGCDLALALALLAARPKKRQLRPREQRSDGDGARKRR